MKKEVSNQTVQIRTLNDLFRKTFVGGAVVVTQGVSELDEAKGARILSLVRSYNTFDRDNDPYGEHDFGSIDAEGTSVFWKIDYYDKTLSGHSNDPADTVATVRVLTIMLAEEW